MFKTRLEIRFHLFRKHVSQTEGNRIFEQCGKSLVVKSIVTSDEVAALSVTENSILNLIMFRYQEVCWLLRGNNLFQVFRFVRKPIGFSIIFLLFFLPFFFLYTYYMLSICSRRNTTTKVSRSIERKLNAVGLRRCRHKLET